MDSAERYKRLGVDVFIGAGRFIGPDSVAVDGKTLNFTRAAVCTGARAVIPLIPGLKEAGCLTNETIFDLTILPRRMAVIGGGPVGCELAQAFARFGSEVCVFEQTGRILPREDPDAARVVQDRMEQDGVRFVFGARIIRVEVRGRERVIHYEINGEPEERAVDEILVATGRAPNVEGLGLENAGVQYDAKMGIKVNDRLQTTNPGIYAAGDVCSPFKLTHVADALAQILIQNALFPHPFGWGYAGADALVIPWCTYTDPEIAHVGMYAAEARAAGIDVETFSYKLDEVDRAVLDGEDRGFARVHVRKGTDGILGATIVAAHAGEMIGEFTLAMKAGAGLGTITQTIHPYPTQAEVIKKTATVWRKTQLTGGKKKILEKWFAWMR
jgi:pyruvate/2-oxoglutarate dehydrogenase complex dihydrolipoamide dehydrogenase (E3) component